MSPRERRLVGNDLAALSAVVASMTDWQRWQLCVAAGIPEKDMPEAARKSAGTMMCCGCEVPEGEYCPVCGSRNWELPA